MLNHVYSVLNYIQIGRLGTILKFTFIVIVMQKHVRENNVANLNDGL